LRGEIWISGPGVAKGYGHGVGEEAFRRLRQGEGSVPAYRSGDAGRFDEHGRLQLLGRLDDQLKLRGWRIEPEEIERVAETTPGVVSAKVILDTRIEPHELRLFFLGAVDEASVMKTLRDWLPAAMAPATVTHVAHLPRTATGKLDHRALLELASTRGESSPDDYEPLQLEIATIWREVVGRGWPRIDENFFDAGGHSLALARLVNQLRARHFDIISLRQVVRNPTIRAIALIIQSASDAPRAKNDEG
jgi:aryl carrier-like protein